MAEIWDTEKQRVLTSDERIELLQKEISDIKNSGDQDVTSSLAKFISNPTGLSTRLGLKPNQVRNLKGISAGAGAFIGNKYLGEAIGDELSSALGAALAAFLAKKVLH